MPGVAFILIVVLLILSNAIKILREWERGVILRLGKFQAVRGPGITFVIPMIERMYRINTRVITVDVPPQDVITRDNVTLKVNAVVFFRILGPREAVVNVEDYYGATFQKAQTVLRNVLGQFELDGILAERDMINHRLQSILDTETEQWGSRWIRWKSRTLTYRRRCNAPWPGRLKPSANAAQRSSRQKASIKPPRGSPRRRTL